MRFDDALALWAEATLGGRLVDHFDREKSVIESEIRRKYQSIEKMRFETELNQLMYSGTFRALAPSPAGTLESLSLITHDEAQRFHLQYYTPANLSMVCVGDIRLPQLMEKLERCLGQYVSGETAVAYPPQLEMPVRVESRKEYQESQVSEPSRAKINRFILLPATIPAEIVSIAAQVISGVLTTELRDKQGLVYSAGAGGGTMAFCHNLNIGADEFDVKQLPAIEQVLRETIAALPTLTNRFLEEKEADLRRYAMYDVPWVRVQENVVGDISMFGRIGTRQEQHDECESLTVKDWKSVAEYLSDDSRAFTSVIYK